MDQEYVCLLGKAVYAFAYYEWCIIYIIQQLKPGFLGQYCRGNYPLSSGKVKEHLEQALADAESPEGSGKGESGESAIPAIKILLQTFEQLVPKRNALIHAHPITDQDGSQILSYQGGRNHPIRDIKWDTSNVEQFIQEVGEATVSSNQLLQRLLRAEMNEQCDYPKAQG